MYTYQPRNGWYCTYKFSFHKILYFLSFLTICSLYLFSLPLFFTFFFFFFTFFFFFFTFFYLFLDADYADDSAVLAYVLKDATFLLHSIERTAKEIRLYLDADKTEFLCFNQDASEGMKSLNGEKIKQVEDFKYLGSYIASTEHDVNIRLGKAWDALNELDKIWKSNLPDNLKRNFFRAAVETVLLYGSVSWTLTTHLEKKIDWAYTRMLRAALNRALRPHPANQ